jgi:hypothetical protein
MEKINISDLKEMIKSKFLEKGLASEEINEEMLKNISEKIKNEVNDKIKNKNNIVDINLDEPINQEDFSDIEPSLVTTSIKGDGDDEYKFKKEGELDERERALIEKEEELKAKEEELKRKEKEMEYKPEIPEKIQDMGSEKLFVFNENQLSISAENLSNIELNIIENPETKITMKDLWLKDGKKDAEIYIVKFEKIGNFEFQPFEGITSYIKDVEENNLESEKFNLDTEENINVNNMKDSISPIKNVTKPMVDDKIFN